MGVVEDPPDVVSARTTTAFVVASCNELFAALWPFDPTFLSSRKRDCSLSYTYGVSHRFAISLYNLQVICSLLF